MSSDRTKAVAFFVLSLLLLQFVAPTVHAAEQETVEIHYFYMEGCPACEDQEEFMEENIIDEYDHVEINKYDVFVQENQVIFHELAEKHDVEDPRLVTPTTFINGHFFQGFHERYGQEMISIIEGEEIDDVETIRIPFLGEIHPEDISLPILAFALGSVDGMNVCSIGALVMILMIVLSFDDRKKIFFYGFLFILVVILTYGLLIFAWYHVLDAVMRHIGFLQYIIGAAGIIGGAVFFKQFVEFYKHGPQCDYSDAGFVTKARMKVKESFEGKQAGPLVLIGSVVFFAAVVTIIELPCSAALPLAFSGVLVDAQLAGMTYIFYIALYLFFYMLIELVIFSGAVITKDIWFGSGKFVTWITLIGAIILFVLGISYLFGIGIA